MRFRNYSKNYLLIWLKDVSFMDTKTAMKDICRDNGSINFR